MEEDAGIAGAADIPEEEQRATKRLDEACDSLMGLRKRRLLVLYYPDPGSMEQEDVRQCYVALKNSGLRHQRDNGPIDVLVHTFGGDSAAAYQLAQCIRDFSNNVCFLVPHYAYSAGTLL